MIPISGFLPDVDPTSAGVITSCDNLIPTVKGSYEAAKSYTNAGYSALGFKCVGAASITLLDGSTRLIAGVDDTTAANIKLYEGSGTTWTDRSRAAAYTVGTKRWRLSAFGNVILATNGLDTLQASTGAGVAFADVAGAPKAYCMDVSQGFVMLANYNDGSAVQDGWYCSAIYDYTSWTPSVTTQATKGRLVDSPGPIRAIKALGANFVAYKDRAIFIGQYAGPPIVWSWSQIPGEIGCSGADGIVSTGTAHYFWGGENCYVFDGTRPAPIGDGVKDWFFTNLNNNYKTNIQGLHDRKKSRIYWFFPDTASTDGTCNKAIVYNYRSNKWGVYTKNVESVLEFIYGGVTIDGLTGTMDGLTFTFDDPSLTSVKSYPSVFDTTHTLQMLSGTAGTSSVTFGDVGDDAHVSTLRRVRVRYINDPDTASMTNSYKMNEGEALTVDSTSSLTDGKFDMLRSARFHRVSMNTTGECEFSAIDYDLHPDGMR